MKMEYVAYLLGAVFIAGAFRLTYMNSPKHAYIMLGIVVLSIIIAQIKPIQIFSLFGVVVVFVVMIMSRFSREKDISKWFVEHNFTATQFQNAKLLFSHNSSIGSTSYSNFLSKIGGVPFLFSQQYHSYQNGNTTSIVIHCSYYFNGKIDINELERRFLKQKSITPKTNNLKSQFGYFDLKSCEIYKPAMGGIAVIWRFPPTIEGYNERYEWIRNAVLSDEFCS